MRTMALLLAFAAGASAASLPLSPPLAMPPAPALPGSMTGGTGLPSSLPALPAQAGMLPGLPSAPAGGAGLPGALPLSLATDLLQQALATLPAAPSLPLPLPVDAAGKLPTPAPCRFLSSQLGIDFGTVALKASPADFARQIELQVICDRAGSLVISTQPLAGQGDPLAASGLPVQIRAEQGALVTAHVALDSEGRPLAQRVITVPAGAPVLIPVRAQLLVAPGISQTPAVAGVLQQIDLQKSLYLHSADGL